MSTTSAPTEPQAPDPLAPDPRGRAKQRPGDLWFSGSALFAGSMILATLAAVAFFLIIQSIPALGAGSDEASLISTNFWDYVWPLLFGTIWAAFLALLMAVPLSLGVALFITHYAPRRIAQGLAKV